MRDVAVIGVGITPFGELWNKSLRNLFTEAALAAIDDSGVDRIQSMYVGCMSSGLFVGQEHLAALAADYLGQRHIPSTRVESACASGGLAMRLGYMEVASGMNDVVLVGGVEKMTDSTGPEATFGLGTAADQEYECYHGITFPGLYALIARAHMEKYGTTREQLAMVAVKNHKNGANNPNAQYPFEITVDGVLKSVMIADPLRILDCSPITDGAAAAILCPVDMAKKLGKPIIKVIGTGHATDTIQLCDRDDPTWLEATYLAAKQAYAMADKKPSDIDFFEVHDCFTIAEICVMEALGLVDKGKGGPAVEAGKTAIEGEFPINPSGGLKSKGHPVGATGIAQVYEIVKQFRGEAEGRQVKNARIAMTQNMGGSGASTVTHIFERE
ncbi:MAG: thiolase domain-containing protein [Acidobacteria bacterium]|nr:thiolase domain-containing protein [Acidobacteriota bacterium]MCG2817264.1 thiolase domain-containing protein [Candidatus Aminicenantes bacterium]MBU1475002.1 thiolase domain-containing protein [Acidobacteriota bacterium]MBU2439292.1 thiolase domain-containing protein [Acidobacteriota bacterium]MBU4254589.1 thiolase domain-containing protein [Acidobacteriota bacterium]